MSKDLRMLLAFTAIYGVVAIGLMAGQPRVGMTQVADAGGNFEAPMGGIGALLIRYASAE